MAHSIPVLDLSMAAAADYSSYQFYLVKQNTSTGRATVASTRGEKVLGVLQDDPDAAGRSGSVRVYGVAKVIVGAAVTIDDELTVDASGRAIKASLDSDYVWGRALTAASNAGEVIAALVTIGGIGKGTGVVAADGFIPLPLTSAREIASNDIQNLAAHGGILCSDSVPDLARVNGATDKALRLTWAAGEQDEIQFAPVPKPPDLASGTDLSVHMMLAKDANTDTAAVVDVQVWDGVGDTEMGGNTGALSVATLAEYSVTIANANVAAAPGFLNVGVVPGAHANDAIYCYAAWLEYTRQ